MNTEKVKTYTEASMTMKGTG